MTLPDSLNGVLQTLTEAPPDQIDPKIVQKLKDKIAAGITSGDLSVIIDECKMSDVATSKDLASPFALMAMRVTYRLLKNEELCADAQNES